jgi:hypothetical protein
MWGETEAQRATRMTEIREALAVTETLSDADRKALLGLGFLEFPKVITAHQGHRGSVKVDSLLVARRQFGMASDTLIALLDRFHDFSGTDAFHERRGRPAFERLLDEIQKELFAFSTLAHSVVDHCRSVQKLWNASDFDAQRESHFGSDGLHAFVTELRNALHHRRVFEAEWALRWDKAGEKSSHITLDKAELLDGMEWSVAAKTWLATAGDAIDVRALTTTYRARSDGFYAWYLDWCDKNLPAQIADYRELRRAQKAGLAQSHWNFMLREFLKRSVDPVPYLERYLSEEDHAKALSLPPHSTELVDYVIACIDDYGGCTDELREMAYKLFAVPGATWTPPTPVVVHATLIDGEGKPLG